MLRTFVLAALAVSTACLTAVVVGDEKEEQTPNSRGKEKDKGAPTDITQQVQRYNSDAFAAPPDKFHPGHVKPRKLDPKALKKRDDGFEIQFPSKAPIPTPAVFEGRIYVSGGFHSKEFYCIKADTGELLWGFELDDDGPSSAAVEDGVVVYNTESCTIFAHDAKSGKLLWSYWLGDPLMSSPSIAAGRVFAAYPASGRAAGSPAVGVGTFSANDNNATNNPVQGAQQILPQIVDEAPQQEATKKQTDKAAAKKPAKTVPPMTHVLACFDLKTGKILWQRWIDSDVMSAPVASGKQLHVATFGGTLYKFDQTDGAILSAKKQRATSAPVAVGNRLVYSKRTEKHGEKTKEGIATQTESGQERVSVSDRALNLDAEIQARADLAATGKNLDAGNGFTNGAPANANPQAAIDNVGQASVSTLQAYQGARLLVSSGFVWGCPSGDKLVCTRLGSDKKLWEIKLKGDLKKEGGSLAAPPAAAGGRLFLSTLSGEVLEVDAKKGKILKRHKVGAQTRFQPIIVGGRIYVTTQDGKLVCFDTGNKKLTGWTQWGGNAARTGVVENLAKM
jgi:outer membrane protein assembly factor BamB